MERKILTGLALLVFGNLWLLGNNLLPNPSFEKGKDGIPLDWHLSEATEGYWEKGGDEGNYSVSLIGKEGQCHYWYTKAERILEKGKTYLFSFYAKRPYGASIISGTSFCNRYYEYEAKKEWKNIVLYL